MKLQEKILNELWLVGKKENYPTIAKNTGLTQMQVANGVRELRRRRLVIKSRENKRTYAEFNDAVIPRIKTILRRAKEDEKTD